MSAASAATCTSGGGVSVVVDFRELGGGILTECAPDGGGKSATAIFQSVGVRLTYATRQPGFVCRVNDAPAEDPCTNTSPANATWGLWWADGTRASWTYSSSGVGGLTVPAGGSVGWSWQQDRPSGSAVPPGVAPPVNPASPSPTSTPTPTSSPSATPTGGSGGGGSSSPTATPTPGGGKGGKGGKGGGSGSTTSPSASPSATPSGSPSASEFPSESSSGSPSASASQSPLASESPGDSQPSDGASSASEEPSLATESPGDSSPSAGSEPSGPASESPGDSRASGAEDDQPGRVPAPVTWGVVALLAIGILVSALVARRRRGA
ncbi:hypothetical protein [Nocardioides exalbidus]|uniref:hypothetical protein n=1 Tax=Nocardioides exalbidus TaxID=402596 RepID=UPI00111512C5|nr:hypothetical protein [Nocardioides exalbidus]